MLETSTPDARTALLENLDPGTRQALEDAEARLEHHQRSATQREWLLITQALNRTRAEVLEDGGLRLLALAFVKEKREHGGASWDVLLDMTDEQLLALHGFPDLEAQPEAPQEPAGAPQEPDDDGADPHRP